MPAPYEAATGFLLSRLGSLAQRSWLDLLGQHGVSPHQHAVLLVMLGGAATSQQEITRVIGVDPRNMVGVIDGLVDAGLVEREIDRNDRRRRVLSLTPTGRSAAVALASGAADIEREFLSGLDAEERAQLNALLHKLLASR